MATYYAYLLDEAGHVASRIDLECADDEAAKERAQYLPHENGAELWLLDRLIAVLGPTVQAQHPMDVADKLEKLLTDAEDCALLSKLASDPAKRERFARLAKRADRSSPWMGGQRRRRQRAPSPPVVNKR